jgi:acetyl esterase/lipase
LLTVIKAPDRLPWTAALFAGEFGYWAAVVPLVAACAGLLSGGFTGKLTAWVAFCSVVLLVQPCFQAWWIGRTLPAELDAALGPGARGGKPFSFAALFGPGPRPVPARAYRYADGLDLGFYRAVGSHAAPCVLIVHGGGWDSGARGQIETLNFHLADEGFAVADIDYRLAPKAVWPAQRDDVLAALRFVKANARDLGVDPRRLVLLGRSAGGQIAEAVGYSCGDPDVRGVVALYAPADMHFAWAYAREDDALRSPGLLRAFLGGPPSAAPAAYDSASGFLLASASSPPTLLVHGKLDTLVWYRQSERLAAKLTEKGVAHVFVTLPWATHAVEYHPQGPSGQLTLYAIDRFLNSVTADRAVRGDTRR